ncbi:glucose dehydrogenase [FAD, quinone]-like [Spodoptera litura]|uniref:Glucose dehydrogenase [FAD, quinone]-like n=1 Tax=Spodoptera litura TaxID=69820 RepID=A0A9J7EHI6_SPOLT|nr:glucose dehydrogenase [FAD, quinone]-like [Spodoptera litura]
MNTTAVLASLVSRQGALYTIMMLQLTGYLYPTPALLKSGDSFDYIIVGGGTAGSVIATRLAQKKYNVLLIEAGQDAPFESVYPSLIPYLKYSHSDWNYTSVNDTYSYQCHKGKNVDLTQGKMLGGTGALNYMVWSRGNPKTFEKWHWITKDPTWKWENVLPYFIKSEAIHDSAIMNSTLKDSYGANGYIGITRENKSYTADYLKGFEQLGKTIIADIDGNRNGYARGLITVYNGRRQDSGSQYLKHVTYSSYLAVAKDTLVTKILFDEDHNAVGVQLITDDGRNITVNARQEIIVTAGAIKSPQLLLLSGIGPCRDLKKLNIPCIADLPVGKNLQDHIAAFIPHTTNKILTRGTVDPHEYPSGLFVGYASLNVSHIKHHIKYPDYEAIGFIMNNMKFLIQFCALTFDFPNSLCNKLYEEANGRQVLITLLSNLYGYSRGQVRLNSTDPQDPPLVITDSFSNDSDLDNFVDYIVDYLKVEETEAFKKLSASRVDLTSPHCDAFEAGSRGYWRCYSLCMMTSMGHYGGTCAMGSVVDSRLRVRHVKKLRVADASVMPTLVAGNIFSAVVMIGEKVSDFIIEDAGSYNDVEHEQIREDQLENLSASFA